MAPEKQHIESLEDMVFKNRNREYGAYYLRMRYRKYVTVSLIIGVFIIGAVVAYPVIASYINKNRLIKEQTSVETEILNMPKEELPPPPPPPEALEQKVKFTAPVVVNDTVEEGLATQDELENKPSTELPPTDEEIKIEETCRDLHRGGRAALIPGR